MFKKHKIICLMALLPFILLSGTLAGCADNGNGAQPAETQTTDPINYEAQIYAEHYGITIDEALRRSIAVCRRGSGRCIDSKRS